MYEEPGPVLGAGDSGINKTSPDRVYLRGDQRPTVNKYLLNDGPVVQSSKRV